MKKVTKIMFVCFLCLTSIIGFILSKKSMHSAKAATIQKNQALDTNFDSISVSNLSIDGLINQKAIKKNENTIASFDKTSELGSLVFTFKYDVCDTNTSSSNHVRIHFTINDGSESYWWNEDNSLWMRGDGVYTRNYETSFNYHKENALSKGEHIIEFGRKAILENNNPTGNYYVYYKVDGTEIYSTINPYDKNKLGNSIFFNFGSENTSNKIYDKDYVITPYEIADEISVSNLKINNVLMKQSLLLDHEQYYSYNLTSEHNSVIFKFLYEVNDPNNVSCQIHFSDGYSESTNNPGGMIWLRNDYTFIRKDDKESYIQKNKAFEEAKIYSVEAGRLYIDKGNDVGKYYVYLSVDGNIVADYITSTVSTKNSIFLTGKNGDTIYDYKYIPVELETGLYLYEWDTSMSGILYTAKLNKGFIDVKNINEVGFIISPKDNPTNIIKLKGELKEENNNYIVKAALLGILDENIAKEYEAKLYINFDDNNEVKTKIIKTSFHNELDDLSNVPSDKQNVLNAIKDKVLNVTLDEDSFAVTGATKTGDLSSETVELKGAKESYSSFVLNGETLINDSTIKIGYTNYKVALNSNKITLTKQTKNLIYGGSEHFKEINEGHDEKMTASNLSPMARELGLSAIRLDISFGELFTVTSGNTLIVNQEYRAKIQGVIDELKENAGITDFLGVFWVTTPNGFVTWTGRPWGEKTAPNPETQPELYLEWLKLNGEAARVAAELFPDILNYEAWNEPELMEEEDGPLARPDGTNYSIAEKARILTDLMYYYNKNLKSVNPKITLSTPSVCCFQYTDSHADDISLNFLKALYNAINDNIPVPGYQELDKNANNYFEAINVHPYLSGGLELNSWKNFMNSLHDASISYNDGGTEIWITEFGFPYNRTSDTTSKMKSVLDYANELDYITKFYFYKIHDYTEKIDNDKWGLYDYDGNIKDIGLVVKEYIKKKEDQ